MRVRYNKTPGLWTGSTSIFIYFGDGGQVDSHSIQFNNRLPLCYPRSLYLSFTTSYRGAM